MLTLTGTAGVGKSRLAREALFGTDIRNPNDAIVDLSDCSDGPGAWNAVLAEVCRSAAGPPLDTTTALLLLASRIDSSRTVVLLDNCDPVIAHIALDIDWLLQHCPNLVVVLTSRVPANLSYETVLPVVPLPVDSGRDDYYPCSAPASQLLLARIDSHYSGSAAVADRLVLDEISKTVGGVPLALELAATTIARIGPGRTLAMLEAGDDLDPLPYVDAPARHRTMHEAIAWGTRDLEPAAADLLLLLAQCAGAISEDLVRLLGSDDPAATERTLETLTRRSMLEQLTDDHSARIFRFVPTVRTYCRRLLTGDARRAALRTTYRGAVCALARALSNNLLDERLGELAQHTAGVHALDFLCVIRHLIEEGRTSQAAAIAFRLQDVWIQHGYLTEVEELFTAPRPIDRVDPYRMVLLGSLAVRSGRYERAAEILGRHSNPTIDECGKGVAVVRGELLRRLGERTRALNHFRMVADEPGRSKTLERLWIDIATPLLAAKPDKDTHADLTVRIDEVTCWPIRAVAYLALADEQLRAGAAEQAL
ncbi:MAG: hypothetical protein GX539_15835, partial [Candidatus Cloacimonetes bacterium]|nr:hypothetical protein [Candidatus Cloacimonadota bacterium]